MIYEIPTEVLMKRQYLRDAIQDSLKLQKNFICYKNFQTTITFKLHTYMLSLRTVYFNNNVVLFIKIKHLVSVQ